MKRLTIILAMVQFLLCGIANAETRNNWTSTELYGSANRVNNINLAVKAINGVIIPAGGEFSYNNVVGERTEKRGFKEAGSFFQGKTVKTIGGGICQVSSTIFAETRRYSKIVVTEHHKHSKEVRYGKNGADATVSWGSKDFKFRNEFEYPVKLLANVSNGRINVRIIKAN